ncbi:hypothetical protein [Microbacterium foliorum]|uniref:hypothetical protein n=1 Tax=Microbacterium foliorum TaxID=104336 RepID=UPI001D50A1E2|nr:hypothetical protein [Microbacterium foliorum]CAH0179203.1 hypothetical protein SRABI03_01446 [Microbacterium foliorum]CAH0204495.1 hypothetical protein SRABI44_02009 [Microbacterium foliorum]
MPDYTVDTPSEDDETVLRIIQTLIEVKVAVHSLGQELSASERAFQRRLAIDSLDQTIEFARHHYLIPRGIHVST